MVEMNKNEKPSLLNKGSQASFTGAYSAMYASPTDMTIRNPLLAATQTEVGRQTIIGGCSLYYAVVGSVVNICHSLLVDATSLIKERKNVYRFGVKKEVKAAFTCLNDLMKRIRVALKESYRGGEQYQIWMDFTDRTEELVRPDIQKLYFSMDNYLNKLKIKDSKYICSIILAETMLKFCGRIFDTVFSSFEDATGIDIRVMFDTSDLSDVLYHWSKVADLTTSGDGNNVEFCDDPNCKLAMKVIERKMSNPDIYDLASEYCVENNEVLQNDDSPLLKEALDRAAALH